MSRRSLFRNRPLFLKLTCYLLITSLILAGCSISPQPLTLRELEEQTANDLALMQAGQEAVGETPITLYDAMARALKYNLDHRLKLMEQALAVKQLDVSRYNLLPELTASAGYNHRSNDLGSTSQSLLDGSQSLVASRSSERASRTADITIMWNVLDFGVSYAQAKQEADRILILEERRRKVIQNILQDVRYAYWRAVSAERLIQDMVGLLEQTKIAFKHSQQIAVERLQPPRESLEYQKELLENIRLLWSLIQNLTPAKVELAALMNLTPGESYRLTEENWTFPEMPSFNVPVRELEQMALVSRPEMREEHYKARISAQDVRKSILSMMPSLSIEFGPSYDGNDFLYNQSWWNAGSMVSHNLLKLFSGPKAIKAAKAQQEIDTMRRQAVGMAIMVQVNLAYQRYQLASKEYYVSRHLEQISNQLHEQISVEQAVGDGNALQLIKSQTNALIAKMRHYQTYSELQSSVGRIYSTLGIDLLPAEIEATDLATLAVGIQESIQGWQETVNVELAAGASRPEAEVAGLPDPGLGFNELSNKPYAAISFAPGQKTASQEKISLETLLSGRITTKEEPAPAMPLSSASIENQDYGTNNRLRTAVIVKQPAETADAPPIESMVINLRSAGLTAANEILRRRLLGDMEEGPVRIKVKSTGYQPVRLIRKDAIDSSRNTTVQVRLSSPLAVPQRLR